MILRRPLFGRHGRWVVAGFCGYELAALVTPLPTLTSIAHRYRAVAVVFVVLLTHHLLLERETP